MNHKEKRMEKQRAKDAVEFQEYLKKHQNENDPFLYDKFLYTI